VSETAPAAYSSPEQVTLDRADDQIKFYERRSKSSQWRYKALKGIVIVSAALIPVMATYPEIPEGPRIAGGLGILITVIESFLQLNRYQTNWTSYRATAESLKHEKYLYLAQAGSYLDARNPQALLAERVETLISSENTNWIALSSKDREKSSATTA
jgi:hypothetical protein